jgi:hypothetical protein
MTEINARTIDQLLDSGRLSMQMRNGNFWKLRRNGATKRWARDPERFYVGVKAGLRVYDAIAAYRDDLPRGGHLPNSPYLKIAE